MPNSDLPGNEPRTGWTWGQLAILAALAAYAFVTLGEARRALPVVGAMLLALLLLRPKALSLLPAVLVGALCLYAGAPRALLVWPAYLLVPILAAAAVAYATGAREPLWAATRPGRLGKGEWGWVALISAVAGLALVSWFLLFQPDLSRFRTLIPQWPLPALIAAGLAGSVLNALLEEFVWRGVLLRWLRSRTSAVWAVAIQAVSFGAFHYAGFPSGPVGVVLAGTYGAMLGALALRSGGLLAAVVAHVAADLVIFTIVAAYLAGRL